MGFGITTITLLKKQSVKRVLKQSDFTINPYPYFVVLDVTQYCML